MFLKALFQFVLVLIGALILSAIFSYFVMLLWNWLIPAIFGFSVITWKQAFGLCILIHLLFPKITLNKENN